MYVDGPATYTDLIYGKFIKEIIKAYHGFDPETEKHIENFDTSDIDVGDLNTFASDRCRVLSMRVRYAFCLSDSPFQSAMTPDQRKTSEQKIVHVLNTLQWDVKWRYESLEIMTPERRTSLIMDHFLSPTEEDMDLVNAYITSDRPRWRWIYLSEDKEFFVLVNDEDNRVGVLKKWWDVKSTFEKLAKVTNIFNEHLPIARDEVLGKLVSCPTNIGTGMRLSALVTLPNLCSNEDALKKIAKKFGLSIRWHYGEHSKAWDNGEVDVSNKARLGISEKEIVEQVYAGVRMLMQIEKEVARNPHKASEIVNAFMD